MREEEILGPKELVESKPLNDEEENADDKDSDYHREKLRLYQLNRLKYYYAIVECDSVETASKIYDECDNQEFEKSATRFQIFNIL